MKILFASMLMLMLGSAVSGRQQKAVIVFPAEFNGIVNAYVNFRYRPLEVRTKTDSNALTVRYVMADKPTHLYFSRMLGNTNEVKFQSLLTLPNDSIVLSSTGTEISYAKGYSDFIDNLISIEEIYPQQKISILRNGNDIR
jgi:hypothetical protein